MSMKFVVSLIFLFALFVAAVFIVGYTKPAEYNGSISKTFYHSVDSLYSFCDDVERYADYRDDIIGTNVLERKQNTASLWQEFDKDGGIAMYELVGKNRNTNLEYRCTSNSSNTYATYTYTFKGNNQYCLVKIEEQSRYDDPFYNSMRLLLGADKQLQLRMNAIELKFATK